VPVTVWGTASGQTCQVAVRRRACPQFWQASGCLPRHPVPRLSPEATPPRPYPVLIPSPARIKCRSAAVPQVPPPPSECRTGSRRAGTTGDNSQNGRTEVSGSTLRNCPGGRTGPTTGGRLTLQRNSSVAAGSMRIADQL
jgi:hypothetical protein